MAHGRARGDAGGPDPDDTGCRILHVDMDAFYASVDRREMQYLYREGDDFVFMDTETYDQPHIPSSTIGDAANYLLEEQTAVVAFNEGVPLYVELPAAVELTVSQTDPGLQGDRATGGTKPATLETGALIQVPLFITTGEKIRVDTRTGQYLGRA